jgi:glutathione peroxidase
VVTALSRVAGTNADKIQNEKSVRPLRSIYDIPIKMIDGRMTTLEKYRGKKMLIVNTASDCGYTGQYDGLQKLHEERGDKLVIIGFPANDFKEQEKADNEQIATFCRMNYGVSFPLAAKSIVVKEPGQHDIYKWLSDKHSNGWLNKAPSWNFSKYLVNEEGVLTHYFGPAIEPGGPEIEEAVQ